MKKGNSPLKQSPRKSASQSNQNEIFARVTKNQEQKLPQQEQRPGFLSRFFGKLCCIKTNNRRPPTTTKQNSQSMVLPRQQSKYQDKITLVLDLDETLVHSSFDSISNPDYCFPIFLDGSYHNIYVLKRPFADEFLQRTCELFEVVLFTASVDKYAAPLMEKLDTTQSVPHKLFRDSCTFHQNMYVKDLKRLNRDMKKVIIIDNSPFSYLFHPENAIPISSWFDDKEDVELKLLLPILESLANVINHTVKQYYRVNKED